MNSVRLYYIYDRASGYYMYFLEASADAVALRQFIYSCKNDFKAVAEDLSLYCLGVREDDKITPNHELIFKYHDTTKKEGVDE